MGTDPISTPLKHRNFPHVPNVSSGESAFDIFSRFISEHLVNRWVTFTKHYSEIHYGTSINTNASELYRFIAAIIYMGINYLPRLEMYWDDQFCQPFISQNFTYDRFKSLCACFSVSDPNDDDTFNDPVKHCDEFMNHLNKVFSANYNLTQHLSLDEAMVGFKGWAKIKQFIRMKPHRFGFKLWCLCCQGYLFRFELYQGAGGDDMQSGTKGIELVKRMTQGLEHRDLILYTDSYFTSPELLKEMALRGIAVCGSTRSNRKGMPDIDDWKASAWPQGKYVILRQNDMALVIWKDRKLLRLLYNHRINIAETVDIERLDDNRKRVVLTGPVALNDYMYRSRYVDIMDQRHYSYLLGRKAQRAAPRLIWWLIDVSILNAFKLWSLRDDHMTQLDFRIRLMNKLMERGALAQPTVLSNSIAPTDSCLVHYLVKTQEDRDCSECSHRPENRIRTTFMCAHCHVHLCIGECFRKYHEK